MILRPDWRRILARAWSVRLFALAILAQAIDVALPWFRDAIPVSDQWFGVLTLIFCVAGLVARFVQQRGFPVQPS